jgi:hypothetical protein
MTHFSQAIDTFAKQADQTNTSLANLTGLSHTDFSRWRRSESLPTEKAMAKLVAALPRAQSAALVVCWLRDMVPEDFADVIIIRPKIGEGELKTLTATEWQAALAFFAREGEHNEIIRKTLIGMHQLMTQPANKLNEAFANNNESPTGQQDGAGEV